MAVLLLTYEVSDCIHSSVGSLPFFCLYLISKRLNIYYQTFTVDINGHEAKRTENRTKKADAKSTSNVQSGRHFKQTLLLSCLVTFKFRTGRLLFFIFAFSVVVTIQKYIFGIYSL